MTTTTTIRTRSLQPLHEVTDTSKRDRLAESMRRDGWQGRPLLVVELGDGWQGLTGSHRYAAAVAAGLEEIPVVAIESNDLSEDDWCDRDPRECRDEDDMLVTLQDLGLAEAAALVAAEIEANDDR